MFVTFLFLMPSLSSCHDDVQVEGLARQLYPDLVGDAGLDSAKAFTVEYDAEEEDKDKELSTHFDNAEVGVSFGEFLRMKISPR